MDILPVFQGKGCLQTAGTIEGEEFHPTGGIITVSATSSSSKSYLKLPRWLQTVDFKFEENDAHQSAEPKHPFRV